MRLFVGIPLDAVVVQELSSLVARLRRREDGLRWTAPESWHITVQFLGETGVNAYGCVAARLGEVRAGPVQVRLGELGFFDRSGVFVVEVQVSPELTALVERVTAATAGCGFEVEKRAYHPHITLARTKGHGKSSGLDTLRTRLGQQPAFSGFTAREFLLYESFLGAGGSRYEMRERYSLSSS